MSLTFLFPYLMLNTFRMLIHPSSGACDLFVELLHGLYCTGMSYVVFWLGWCGIRMLAEAVASAITVYLRMASKSFSHLNLACQY